MAIVSTSDVSKVRKKFSRKDFYFLSDEGLTLQEILFADSYTRNPDPIEAAIAAGIDQQIAKSWSFRTLRSPMVKRRIEDNLSMARRSSVMSVRERLETLTTLARSSISDCVSINGNKIDIDLNKAKKRGSDRGIVSIKIDDKYDPETGMSIGKSRGIQMESPIKAIQELNRMTEVYDKKINKSGAIVILQSDDAGL